MLETFIHSLFFSLLCFKTVVSVLKQGQKEATRLLLDVNLVDTQRCGHRIYCLYLNMYDILAVQRLI